MALDKTLLTLPLVLTAKQDGLWEGLYAFLDAGTAGSQPAVIPDIVGVHDISMTYNNLGDGITAGGDLKLSHNGNGSTNTHGTLHTLDDAYKLTKQDNGLGAIFQIVAEDILMPSGATNESYLVELAGWQVIVRPNYNIDVVYLSRTGHGWATYDLDVGLTAGGTLEVAAHVRASNWSTALVVNGVQYPFPISGDPTNPGSGRQDIRVAWKYLNRHQSWNNYYGIDATVRWLGWGVSVPHHKELTDEEIKDLALDPIAELDETVEIPAVPVIELLPVTVSVGSNAVIRPEVLLGAEVYLQPNIVSTNQVVPLPSVVLTTKLDITPVTVKYSSTVLLPSVNVTSAIEVAPVTTQYGSKGLRPTVSVTAEVELLPSTSTVIISSIKPTVVLTQVIVIDVKPDTATYEALTLKPTVLLSAKVELVPNTVTFNTASLSPTVYIVPSGRSDIISHTISYVDTPVTCSYTESILTNMYYVEA